MEKIKNKGLYMGYICIGFAFLFFPTVSIFDVMPDFIGYLLIIKGVGCMFDLNEDIYSARSSFIKLFFINLAKNCLVPLLVSLNDETTVMTAVFIFSIIEGILLYSALSSLFVGVNYLAERADSRFADKGYSDVRITTAIFVVGRYVLVTLPELTVMTSLDYQMTDDLSAFTVYDFKLLITVTCFVISLILGLNFLSNGIKYVKRLKRDEVFTSFIEERYTKDVLENRSLFIRRNTKNAFYFILASFICACPMYFEGVDITPQPLTLVLLLMGISRLNNIDGAFTKIKRLFYVFIPVSCALYAFECYVGGVYHHASYQIADKAGFMYKLWGVAQSVDHALLTLGILLAFLSFKRLVLSYGIDKTVSRDGFQYREMVKNVTLYSRLLTAVSVVSVLAFVINCVFYFIYPEREFIWLFSLVLTALCAVLYGNVLSRCTSAVEDNNM